MKSKRKFKWLISGVLCVALVIVSYNIYVNGIGDTGTPHDNHVAENGHDDDQVDHGAHTGESEVIPSIHYDGEIMMITVEDKQGKPVIEYEINHEKLMHLIVVSHDLAEYYHLHPTLLEGGVFSLDEELPAGSYSAFVDIMPVGYGYHVEPISLQVGTEEAIGHIDLIPDTNFTKMIDGVTVTMESNTLKTGVPIRLNFIVKGASPEPYLGALGHVVILDESAINYVHVHPVSDKETTFETQFDESGIYKVWGEFQFNGKVHVYPFVIDVNRQ